ncbi:bifunctional diguanylate cyclase/phosphodiesterase (plasmid) [Deinococcus aetherius]|uniref:Bifunctional diguanylate cyclase/phosphodiesterase n=1 Tax=Deinococcus aetherius TaxID=200252 RepID=A0ABM8AKI4_9DEIO|nr:GGDEF domain-containing phosphodiesterase [Deinococcus aetherius]BDP44334.1 bifunctional diguanylate cyclase/phosphodiesterase [Deinococcus aetherius]
MTVRPAAPPVLTAEEAAWRQNLLLALPIAGLAVGLGVWLEYRAPQSLPFDRAGYPVLGALLLLLAGWLLVRPTALRVVVGASVGAAGAFFGLRLTYLLHFTQGADTLRELTEAYGWVPVMYVVTYLVPDGNSRLARRLAVLCLISMLLVGAVYTALHAGEREAFPVISALVQLACSNLAVLALTRSLADRLRGRAREHERLAGTDVPTGRLNRRGWSAAFEEELRAREGTQAYAVLFIDLDGFKRVNDTRGHDVGDALLRQAGERLHLLRGGGAAARLGGDEFALFSPVGSAWQAEALAERVRDALQAPYEIGAFTELVTASVGVSVAPHDGTDPETLLRAADLAMYRAKRTGKNAVRRYASALGEAESRRALLERDVQHAAERGELALHYQPLFELRARRAVKVEALLRWTHPGLGPVSPSEFIPLAEATGLIRPLGEWVLRQACADARRLPDALVVAVNVSPVQLEDGDFPALVQAVLHESGLPPERLELELTETAVMRDVDRARHALGQLRALGVRVALDDFGTGHTSLSSLRDLPLDTVKIDRSFVADLRGGHAQPFARTLLGALLQVADLLDLEVVAEGLEDDAQLQALHHLGCHVGQGYLLGRPAPLSDVLDTPWGQPPREEDTVTA